MSKGFITGTNEELIKAYKESRDESYLKELIEDNKGLINLLVSPYLTSIPNSELEDLTSESYIPMLRAIEDYDPEQGVAFSTLLKVYVRQHLNRLYNEATRKKRFTGTTPDSLDRLSEINKEGGTETDSTFEVECKWDDPNLCWHNGFIGRIYNEMFPLTMPYMPSNKSDVIVCDELLTDRKNGDFDTLAVLSIQRSNGEKVEVNRYFKEGEKSFIEISPEEYEERKKMHEKRQEQEAKAQDEN